MKFRFNVTAHCDKVVEIEADTEDEAFDKMGESLYDIDMTDAIDRCDDREYLLLDD